MPLCWRNWGNTFLGLAEPTDVSRSFPKLHAMFSADNSKEKSNKDRRLSKRQHQDNWSGAVFSHRKHSWSECEVFNKIVSFFLATFSVATVGFCLYVPRGAQLQRLQHAIHLPRQLSSAPFDPEHAGDGDDLQRAAESHLRVSPVLLLLKQLQHGFYSDFVNQFINESEYLLESTVFRAI